MARALIQRSDMCMADPMQHGQHWEARTDVPLSEITDMGEALHPSIQSLRPGDLINVCSFENKTWSRLREVASYRIASLIDGKLEVVLVTPITKIAFTSPKMTITAAQKLVVMRNGNSFEVQDERGNVIEMFVDAAQANSFVDQYHGKKLPPAPKEDRSKYVLRKGQENRWNVLNETGELVKEFLNKKDAEQYIAQPVAA